MQRAGETCELVRSSQMTLAGGFYRVRFPDGFELDVWPEELQPQLPASELGATGEA
jgi:hypothetical protein